MDYPLISVVVPCYNIEKYVDTCIDSIIAQSYSQIEIILVNDGSTDNSLEKLNSYAQEDERIVVINKENGGLSDARNAGIKAAKGKYITFIDGDDFISPQYVEHLVEGIRKGADIACVSWYITYPGEEHYSDNFSESNDTSFICSRNDGLKKIFNQREFETTACAKLYPIEFFDDIQFPKGLSFEDLATVPFLFLRAKSIYFCPAKDYYYFQRDDSLLHEDFNQRKMDVITVGKNLIEKFSPQIAEPEVSKLQSLFFGRIFAAYSSIYSQIPVEYTREKKLLWLEMKKVRKRIKIRKVENRKVKLGLFVYGFGETIFRVTFDFYQNRKVKRD